MAVDRIEELAQVLRLLAEEEHPEQVRAEPEDLIRSISPLELSLAEQRLISEGVHPQRLRPLCEVHLRVPSNEVDRFRMTLLPGHPLDTLMAEHQMILYCSLTPTGGQATQNWGR
jgi:DUF438 domain-containing protein